MEYLLKTQAIGGMTEEQFFQFCQENDSMQLERTSTGDITVMEPTESAMDLFNVDIVTELALWNRQNQTGYVFGSNAGFTLPNTSVRSPDGAFIGRSRFEALPENDRKRFAHICPDFVIEILSESDRAQLLQDKMKEWMSNGCLLGWMIDPNKKETTIYRANGQTEIKSFSEVLQGEDVLPGFELKLAEFSTCQLPPSPRQ